MRVTDSLTYNQSLQQLRQQYSDLYTTQAQVSTGVRNANVSDDPAAAAIVLKSDATLRGITQYKRNVAAATSRLNGEESTLDSLTDLLVRAKELATEEGSDTATADTRAAAATEVSQLVSQTVSLGNLQIGDEYVFGGNVTSTAPFQADGSYVGDNAQRQTQIGQNNVITTSHSGQQVFVDSGVISALQALQTAMQSGDGATIRATIANIDTAYTNTQTNLTEVGTRTNTLDTATTTLDAQNTAVTAERSNAADIPIEEASLHLATVQAALQAGLLATSRILNTNLVQYLT